MAYNLEKYREKREKVLGVKKRGISFGSLASIVSLVIILGMGVVVVPKSIAYFNTRHLDDAIYKLQGSDTWPQDIITSLKGINGVREVVADSHDTRIVVTFDKSVTETKDFAAFFKQKKVKTILLNRVSHSQRLETLKKEAKFEGLLQ